MDDGLVRLGSPVGGLAGGASDPDNDLRADHEPNTIAAELTTVSRSSSQQETSSPCLKGIACLHLLLLFFGEQQEQRFTLCLVRHPI
jgi:hypothetical protein